MRRRTCLVLPVLLVQLTGSAPRAQKDHFVLADDLEIALWAEWMGHIEVALMPG